MAGAKKKCPDGETSSRAKKFKSQSFICSFPPSKVRSICTPRKHPSQKKKTATVLPKRRFVKYYVVRKIAYYTPRPRPNTKNKTNKRGPEKKVRSADARPSPTKGSPKVAPKSLKYEPKSDMKESLSSVSQPKSSSSEGLRSLSHDYYSGTSTLSGIQPWDNDWTNSKRSFNYPDPGFCLDMDGIIMNKRYSPYDLEIPNITLMSVPQLTRFDQMGGAHPAEAQRPPSVGGVAQRPNSEGPGTTHSRDVNQRPSASGTGNTNAPSQGTSQRPNTQGNENRIGQQRDTNANQTRSAPPSRQSKTRQQRHSKAGKKTQEPGIFDDLFSRLPPEPRRTTDCGTIPRRSTRRSTTIESPARGGRRKSSKVAKGAKAAPGKTPALGKKSSIQQGQQRPKSDSSSALNKGPTSGAGTSGSRRHLDDQSRSRNADESRRQQQAGAVPGGEKKFGESPHLFVGNVEVQEEHGKEMHMNKDAGKHPAGKPGDHRPGPHKLNLQPVSFTHHGQRQASQSGRQSLQSGQNKRPTLQGADKPKGVFLPPAKKKFLPDDAAKGKSAPGSGKADAKVKPEGSDKGEKSQADGADKGQDDGKTDTKMKPEDGDTAPEEKTNSEKFREHFEIIGPKAKPGETGKGKAPDDSEKLDTKTKPEGGASSKEPGGPGKGKDSVQPGGPGKGKDGGGTGKTDEKTKQEGGGSAGGRGSQVKPGDKIKGMFQIDPKSKFQPGGVKGRAPEGAGRKDAKAGAGAGAGAADKEAQDRAKLAEDIKRMLFGGYDTKKQLAPGAIQKPKGQDADVPGRMEGEGGAGAKGQQRPTTPGAGVGLPGQRQQFQAGKVSAGKQPGGKSDAEVQRTGPHKIQLQPVSYEHPQQQPMDQASRDQSGDQKRASRQLGFAQKPQAGKLSAGKLTGKAEKDAEPQKPGSQKLPLQPVSYAPQQKFQAGKVGAGKADEGRDQRAGQEKIQLQPVSHAQKGSSAVGQQQQAPSSQLQQGPTSARTGDQRGQVEQPGLGPMQLTPQLMTYDHGAGVPQEWEAGPAGPDAGLQPHLVSNAPVQQPQRDRPSRPQSAPAQLGQQQPAVQFLDQKPSGQPLGLQQQPPAQAVQQQPQPYMGRHMESIQFELQKRAVEFLQQRAGQFLQQHPAGQFIQQQLPGQFGQQPQEAQFGQQPQEAQFGQQPQAGQFGQQPQAAQYGQQPQAAQSGQQPQAGQFGQQPQAGQFGQQPQAAQLGQQPQAAQLGQQPQGAQFGKQPQAAQFGKQPQAAQFGKQPQAAQFGQQPQAAQFGKQPQGVKFDQQPQAAQFGKQPQAAQFGQQPQAAQFGQQPQAAQFGQQPQAAQFGQQPQAAQFGQQPQAAQFGQQPQGVQFDQQSQGVQFDQQPHAAQFGQQPESAQFVQQPQRLQLQPVSYTPSQHRIQLQPVSYTPSQQFQQAGVMGQQAGARKDDDPRDQRAGQQQGSQIHPVSYFPAPQQGGAAGQQPGGMALNFTGMAQQIGGMILQAGGTGQLAANMGPQTGQMGNQAGGMGHQGLGFGRHVAESRSDVDQRALKFQPQAVSYVPGQQQAGAMGQQAMGQQAGAMGQQAGAMGQQAMGQQAGVMGQQAGAMGHQAGARGDDFRDQSPGRQPRFQLQPVSYVPSQQQAGIMGQQAGVMGQQAGARRDDDSRGKRGESFRGGQHKLQLQSVSYMPRKLFQQAGAMEQQAGAMGLQAGAMGQLAGAMGLQAGAMGQQAGAMGQLAGAMGQHPDAMGQHPDAMGQHPDAMGQQPGGMGQQPGGMVQEAGGMGQQAGPGFADQSRDQRAGPARLQLQPVSYTHSQQFLPADGMEEQTGGMGEQTGGMGEQVGGRVQEAGAVARQPRGKCDDACKDRRAEKLRQQAQSISDTPSQHQAAGMGIQGGGKCNEDFKDERGGQPKMQLQPVSYTPAKQQAGGMGQKAGGMGQQAGDQRAGQPKFQLQPLSYSRIQHQTGMGQQAGGMGRQGGARSDDDSRDQRAGQHRLQLQPVSYTPGVQQGGGMGQQAGGMGRQAGARSDVDSRDERAGQQKLQPQPVNYSPDQALQPTNIMAPKSGQQRMQLQPASYTLGQQLQAGGMGQQAGVMGRQTGARSEFKEPSAGQPKLQLQPVSYTPGQQQAGAMGQQAGGMRQQAPGMGRQAGARTDDANEQRMGLQRNQPQLVSYSPTQPGFLYPTKNDDESRLQRPATVVTKTPRQQGGMRRGSNDPVQRPGMYNSQMRNLLTPQHRQQSRPASTPLPVRSAAEGLLEEPKSLNRLDDDLYLRPVDFTYDEERDHPHLVSNTMALNKLRSQGQSDGHGAAAGRRIPEPTQGMAPMTMGGTGMSLRQMTQADQILQDHGAQRVNYNAPAAGQNTFRMQPVSYEHPQDPSALAERAQQGDVRNGATGSVLSPLKGSFDLGGKKLVDADLKTAENMAAILSKMESQKRGQELRGEATSSPLQTPQLTTPKSQPTTEHERTAAASKKPGTIHDMPYRTLSGSMDAQDSTAGDYRDRFFAKQATEAYASQLRASMKKKKESAPVQLVSYQRPQMDVFSAPIYPKEKEPPPMMPALQTVQEKYHMMDEDNRPITAPPELGVAFERRLNDNDLSERQKNITADIRTVFMAGGAENRGATQKAADKRKPFRTTLQQVYRPPPLLLYATRRSQPVTVFQRATLEEVPDASLIIPPGRLTMAEATKPRLNTSRSVSR